ncbi:MAG: hypothetical protein ABIS23_02105 [Sphingomicrobium sp.]
MKLSRNRLQLIRWTSAALSFAILVSSLLWDISEGWAVLLFFGFLVIGAPAALITLHLMQLKSSKAERI